MEGIKKDKQVQLTKRDIKILHFLWKWTVSTTSAIAFRFYFDEANIHTGYRRLLYLKQAGFIESNPVEDINRAVWGLTKKGFNRIKHKLGQISSEGFRSASPEHDHLVTAFHRGEWLTKKPDDARTFTERELRSTPVELFPKWVPISRDYRPDGYSLHFKGEVPIITAFEVELNVKTTERYEKVVTHYDRFTTIQNVLWLVETPGEAESILKKMNTCNLQNPLKHNFVLLNQFKKLGWNAKVFKGGMAGIQVSYLLPVLNITKPSLDILPSDSLLNLDSRKKPTNLRPLPKTDLAAKS